MLLEFSVTNWKSYQEKATLSMYATNQKQHQERLSIVKVGNKTKRILPIASIYGGNASGKTNLINALEFARDFIVRGVSSFDSEIALEPFKLVKKVNINPIVIFEFQILIEKNIYILSFSLDKSSVLEERLIQIEDEKNILYIRKYNKRTKTYNYDEAERKYFTTNKIKDFKNKDVPLLNAAYKGTRKNQLFLTNTISQQIKTFEPIYQWFKQKLLLNPSEMMGELNCYTDESNFFYKKINKILSSLDTGISQVKGDKYSSELSSKILNKDPEFLSKLKENLKENASVGMSSMFFTKEQGEISVGELITYHKSKEEEAVKFSMYEESKGTRRLLNLLPSYLDLFMPNLKRIFIIDEIDRNLHPLLILRLIRWYLEKCGPNNRTQFIFTTHSTSLLDQSLFRRDEIWITQRDENGASELYSLREYRDLRDEQDIEKTYLLGRLGGIPTLPYPPIDALIDLEDFPNDKKENLPR